jgi:hypothetical protein
VKREQPVTTVTRREALKTSTVLLGSALLLPGVLTGCAPKNRAAPQRAASADQTLLEDIADTLLPTTAGSPGAKAAGVGATMVLILNDCMAADVQQLVSKGLQEFRAACRDRGGDFNSLQQPVREQLLREMDAAAVQSEKQTHWFGVVRDLALQVYFSSEIGLTRAMRYEITPGRYDACVPLVPGQPAWG